MSIYIFSRPVQTGKTTALAAWAALQKNVGGILMPDREGSRWMLDLNNNNLWEATCNDTISADEALYHIGKFSFYKHAFDAANDILLKAFVNDTDWLIIDEVGKLEMQEKGFYPVLRTIISNYDMEKSTKHLILVVREGLCKDVVDFFGIKYFSIIHDLP